MKKLLLSSCILAAMIVLLGSCKDDEKVDSGSLSIDGTKHSLKKAFAYYYGQDEDGDDTYHYWGIYLTSNEIEIDEDEESTGTGDLVYLYLSALNTGADEVPVGTFELSSENGLHIEYGAIYLNADISEESQAESLGDVESVTLVVTKSGNRYSFKLTITRDGEDDITVNYSGTIKMFES